ncbi:Uma2 family endonuclease [Actinoplanes sp. NPDC024001]|uniref:Uma2 family endonuclease n=1 Tax=Actinoplanes sp. NPDC024001 TaxID=3154598 RepID=UPI0033CE9B53
MTSPSNATTDRVLQKHLFAEAKIEWYLLVEPDMTDYESLTLRLFHLEAGKYAAHAVAEDGQTLILDEPFPISINARALLGL